MEISGAESEGSLISSSCCIGSNPVFSPLLQLDTGKLFSNRILPSDSDLFMNDLM